MKTNIILFILGCLFIIAIIFFQACKKEEPNKAPTCKITSPENGNEFDIGETVIISVDAEDSDGSIKEVRLFINDVGVDSASSFPYKYIWNTSYKEENNYSIKATVYDNEGETASDEVNIVLMENVYKAPKADFVSFNTSGIAPLTVNFIDQSSFNTKSWQWFFGDGGSSTNQNPSHTYNEDGSYAVSLIVRNEFGSDTENKTSYIYVGSGPGGPPPDGYFKDVRDGKEYAFKIIGSQTWMCENLKYQTGNSWCNDDDSTNCTIYGQLYDWETTMNGESSSYSVPSGVQGICPDGWHLPSIAEWHILADYLGGEDIAGGKMKEAGYVHWTEPNRNVTNSSGFTALPGGFRGTTGDYYILGYYGYWWSTSGESISNTAYASYLYSWSPKLSTDGDCTKDHGFSVRCLKD